MATAAQLKLLAINAQLVEADLRRIESEFGIDLGVSKHEESDQDEAYFPQFEAEVRAEAAEMSKHYEVFYCLELSIRKVISDTLETAEGAEWWNTDRVHVGLRDEIARRIQRDMDSAVTLRSTDPIDFTTFGELGELIKSNWDLFGAIFNSRKAVEKVMANLNVLRGPIAHCSPLAEDEVVRLQLSLRDWFRLMG